MLIGVVNTANVPLLFPARALYDPRVKGAFDLVAGTTTVIDPTTCPPSTTSLINFQLAGAIRAGAHPPTVYCEALPSPFQPLGNVYVLDAAEQAAVSDTVTAYNALIAAEADTLGFAFFDPNPALVALKTSGAVPISRILPIPQRRSEHTFRSTACTRPRPHTSCSRTTLLMRSTPSTARAYHTRSDGAEVTRVAERTGISRGAPFRIPAREDTRMSEHSDSPAQEWSAESYARNARFVAELGEPVVDWLDAKPGERVLDVGCG